jgi:uncharacterized protein
MPNETRRGFLKRLKTLYAPLFLGSVGCYGYASLLERHRISVERHETKLALGARGPQKLRIASLTDFHFDPLHEVDFVAAVVAKTNELKPDLILLTGDYITDSVKRFGDLAKILGGLKAPAGVFGCLGNHDMWAGSSSLIARLMAKNGIRILLNEHARVPCAGGEVVVAGLHSAWGGMPNWPAAAHGLTPKDRPFLLMHEPDPALQFCADGRVALQLSGHTHGGQVRLPGYGALRLPQWGKLFQAGFYNVKGMPLYVGRGVGTIGVHLRFLCPPEITCFDITNTDTLA